MAKSLVSFYKINESQLSSLPISEGQIIFVKDKGKMYIDASATDRVQIDGVDFSYGLGIDGRTISISKNGGEETITLPEDKNTTYTFEQDSTDGHILRITSSDGDTYTFTIPDNDTTYSQGTGITISNNTISNAGVRAISTGTTNGSIRVNTNGTAADVAVKGLGDLAFKSSLSASDVGAIASTAKGTANGVAELDSDGKVPSSQLPSYVDDVLEYSSSTDFPAKGESGKIYVATDRNLTYRWGGSSYIEISASLALGENASTAYRGDRGKTAYDHATETGKISAAKASGLYKVAATAQGHIASLTAVTKDDITGLGIPGSDTTYTFSNGLSASGNAVSNSGVRSISTGSSNGTISVNTNGTAADVAVKGLGDLAYISKGATANTFLKNDGTWAVPSDTKVGITETNPTSGTTYYPVWHTGLSGTSAVKANDGLRYYSLEGTTGALGYGQMILGNGTASGTAKNKKGQIKMYSQNTGSATLEYANTTANTTHVLPSTGGTILNTGTTSFTQTLTSGAEVGKIKINGTVTTLYAPAPGNVSTQLASAKHTYYLTGVTETTASEGSQMYNTRLSDTFTGVKYVTSTSEKGGTLTVDDREVTLGLVYAIA